MATKRNAEHPTDRIVKLLEQFTPPSPTDGMTTSQRVELPGVRQALENVRRDAAASFGRVIRGMSGRR